MGAGCDSRSGLTDACTATARRTSDLPGALSLSGPLRDTQPDARAASAGRTLVAGVLGGPPDCLYELHLRAVRQDARRITSRRFIALTGCPARHMTMPWHSPPPESVVTSSWMMLPAVGQVAGRAPRPGGPQKRGRKAPRGARGHTIDSRGRWLLT